MSNTSPPATSETEAIATAFDHAAGTFIVHLPEHTTLTHLEAWGQTFRARLLQRERRARSGLLLDTSRHNFESVACLKFIRSFLHEITQMDTGIYKIAFVQPITYRQPEVVSSEEAYFSSVEEALQWLRH